MSDGPGAPVGTVAIDVVDDEQAVADLVAAGQLSPHISLERPWKEIAQVAQDLMARRFPGKAVLIVD